MTAPPKSVNVDSVDSGMPIIYLTPQSSLSERLAFLLSCLSGLFIRFENEISLWSDSLLKTLRDVTSDFLESHRNDLGPVLYRRSSNLVEESAVESFTELIPQRYREHNGRDMKVYVTSIESGTTKVIAEAIHALTNGRKEVLRQ